jgi:hypothetical protein
VVEKYSTLKVLYLLVQDCIHPTQFACKPAEIITHHSIPWDTILVHLTELASEGLVIFTIPSVITITQAGLDKINELNTASSGHTTSIEKVA